MTATEFCYWLRGFVELAEPRGMSERQVKIMNDHLDLVLRKETPRRGGDEAPSLESYRAVFPISTYNQSMQEVRELPGSC